MDFFEAILKLSEKAELKKMQDQGDSTKPSSVAFSEI
jgi:hypothetical protein